MSCLIVMCKRANLVVSDVIVHEDIHEAPWYSPGESLQEGDAVGGYGQQSLEASPVNHLLVLDMTTTQHRLCPASCRLSNG